MSNNNEIFVPAEVVNIDGENIDNEKATEVSEIIGTDTKSEKLRLRSDAEVLNIARSTNLSDVTSILEFGNEPAEAMSKFSDQILSTVKTSSIEDSKKMFRQLNSIMYKFDKSDFEDKQNIFDKILKKTNKSADRLMGKYKTVGREIDVVYSELVKYKTEMNDSNIRLEGLYAENLKYFRSIEKYIVAGNLIIENMEKNELPKSEERAKSGNPEDIMALENYKIAVESMRQKVFDLETAKMVALQTAPQIRLIQKSNYRLVSKIHSAFVITIPLFKSGVVQAVAVKRQKIVADSLAELDRTTNELMIRNASNIKAQSIDIAKMSGGATIKMETLEKTWQTILEGIEETAKISEENKKIREEGIVKLDNMSDQLKKALANPEQYSKLKS